MNIPEYPYYVYLPAMPPSPPPFSPTESPPPSPKDYDPVLDTPEEIEKWIRARKKNFPCKRRLEEQEAQDTRNQDRGDLSKLEIRMRKRMALFRKLFKKTEDKPGRNPFIKYTYLRKKLTNNSILKEQRIILQCIKYIASNNFLQNS